MSFAPAPAREPLAELPARDPVPFVSRALWAIGGFDRSILSSESCSAARAKYSCMGALVAITSLMAFLSGSYAVYTVFHSVLAAAPAALVWAALIFFLDRFLVSSTRKYAVIEKFVSERPSPYPFRTRIPWLPAIFRLLLAAIIGIVVAKPIEVRMLQPLVQRDALDSQKEEFQKVGADVATLDGRVKSIQAAIAAGDDEVRRLQRALETERDAGAAGRPAGEGPVFHEIERTLDQAKADLGARRKDLPAATAELQNRQRDLEDRVSRRGAALESTRSFISDYLVLQELSARRPEYAGRLPIVSWFLSLLFVLIEMSPVLAKTLSAYDPYDAAVQEKETRPMLRALDATRKEHAAVGWA